MYELVIIKNLSFDLGQGSWQLHFPIFKMERSSREDNIELTSQHPPLRFWPEGPFWLSAGLSSEGWDISHHPGPPGFGHIFDVPATGACCLRCFPASKIAAAPGSRGLILNTGFWADKKGRSWLPTRCVH